MRILSITAGAANMYCGSCFRDNALAAELISRGHQVTLLPLYTPTRTDEPNVSKHSVFFGGISIFLQQHLALFRKTPWLLDQLWDAPSVLKAASSFGIQTNPRQLGQLTLSMLQGDHGPLKKEFQKLLHWLRDQPPPDVVTLPNSLLIGLARPIKETLSRPVCCTLQGEDLFLQGLPEPYRNQSLDLIRANIESVDAFQAVSEYYADFMSDYLGIPSQKMGLVPLGIRLEGYPDSARSRSALFTIGFFARVSPEKGLHLLCETYRQLRHQNHLAPARLEVAGYLAKEHRPYLKGIEEKMKGWGLASEFHYRGELNRKAKIEFLQSVDVLSVPATYQEPKGVFLLEAMAVGVPVVQPRCGAFPEIIRKTSGGLLVEPNDCESLAEGILSIWKSPSLGQKLGLNGFHGVRRNYSIVHMADRALEIYSALVS